MPVSFESKILYSKRLKTVGHGEKLKIKDVKAVSRLAIVVIIIAVLLIAGVAAGLFYTSTHPSAAKKDTLIIGTTDSVETTIDPADAYDFFGWEMIESLGSPLVQYQPGSDVIVPDLATSWSVSSDSLHWTFNLRQGVHFDNGAPFNSTSVQYSFYRNMQMNDPDGPYVGIGYSDIIGTITTPSTYQVEFNLKIPFAAFLSLMACQASCIVDPAYTPKSNATSWSVNDVVQYHAGNARASNPMGLGPYELSVWDRTAGKDTEMDLTANPNYWNSSLPATKNIIIKMYADESSLALAIKSGDVDIAFRQIASTDIASMQSDNNLKVWTGTGAFIQYLCMQENYAPFNNVAVRQAIASAINRTDLVDTVFQGQAQALYSMIPAGMFGHDNAFQSYGAPNYTLTQALLAPLGYNANHKLTFTLWYESSGHYPSSAQQALVLQDSLQKSGVITVNLQPADWASYKQARSANSMPAYIMGWYPDYIDPDDYIYPFVDSSGGSWLHINYNSPTMDSLVTQARAATDSATRQNLYTQINNLIVADCPLVPLYQSGAYAVTNPNVHGVYLDISQQWRNWLLYETK